MTVSEKIAENTMLQAVARVAMAVTLPVLLAGGSYVAGSINTLATAVTSNSTDIALLKQRQGDTDKRMDAMDQRTQAILDALQKLTTDVATTKTDAGYLRDWVEELKRQARSP